MGLFDRFKKKDNDTKAVPQTTNFWNSPFVITHRDGVNDEFYFMGTREIYGKIVHQINRKEASIHTGVSEFTNFYIDPIYETGPNGEIVDVTELRLREWGKDPGPGKDRRAFIAVKGYLKKEQITKEIMGSEYIGKLVRREDGSFYRHMDEDFKRKMIEYNKQQTNFESDLKSNVKETKLPDPTAYFAAENTRLRGALTPDDPANRANNTEER